MNTITYEIDGVKHDLQFPSSVSECDGDQLVSVAASRIAGMTVDEKLQRIARVPANVVALMSPFQKYRIAEEAFDPVCDFHRRDLFWKDWRFPTIEVGGETYYGVDNSFGNVTWGEFIYADQCMMNGLYQAAIAAIFRPERPGWNGETDRRMPFTINGTRFRFPKFESLDGALSAAIIWNYRAVRSACVDAAYPALFPNFSREKQEDMDDEDKDPEEDARTSFSWVNIHRDILGENIQDEDKFLNLPMHTVLYRMNTMVADSRKSKSRQS